MIYREDSSLFQKQNKTKQKHPAEMGLSGIIYLGSVVEA